MKLSEYFAIILGIILGYPEDGDDFDVTAKLAQLETELEDERETRRRWGVERQDALAAQRWAEAKVERMRKEILKALGGE